VEVVTSPKTTHQFQSLTSAVEQIVLAECEATPTTPTITMEQVNLDQHNDVLLRKTMF
jgi:hypothetical protein